MADAYRGGMHLDDRYSLLGSFIRVRVTAPNDPEISRTFDMSQRAPESWLVDAFLLATGQPEAEDPYDDRHYDRDVRGLTFGADRTVDIRGATDGCRIEVLSSRSSRVGEPRVQIVDEDEAERADARWQSAPAPLRRAHVQQELTRKFGIVMPEVDTSGVAELSGDVGHSSPLMYLLLDLPPERRLALRAHLLDAGLLDAAPMERATADELLSSLSWLVDRIGPGGVEQNEHGEFPDSLAREAESAMDWMPISNSPPSPGHALLTLARSARFARRLNGRILPTARTRMMKEKPSRAVAEIAQNVEQRRGFPWAPEHARALALLAIADGSGADADDVIQRVADGLRTLTSADAGADDERQQQAREAVRELMEILAPLGGAGRYGILTPPVRAFARMELL